MSELSIVFGYRNRDVGRVKRCLDSLSLQTYKDFNVIFVDYGSDETYSNQVKFVVESYSFANYCYLFTKGYPWNRSHALNAGVRLSSSEYILLGDVDLIYSPNSISGLMEYAAQKNIVFGSMFYLEKTFSEWDNLYSLSLSKFKNSGDIPIGAIYLLNRIDFEAIRGFDEFYCFWGVEDRDLHHRVQSMGMRQIQINKYRYPIYHQWHPIVSDRKKGFFPEKWWDEINIHYSQNKDKLVRNDDNWGKLTNDTDRPILKANIVVTQTLCKYGKSYDKSAIIDNIITSLKSLKANDCIELFLLKRKKCTFLFYLIKYQNLIFRKLNLPLGIDYIENVEREKYFYPEKDIFYVIWQIIQRSGLIRDYEIVDTNNELIIRMMKHI